MTVLTIVLCFLSWVCTLALVSRSHVGWFIASLFLGIFAFSFSVCRRAGRTM